MIRSSLILLSGLLLLSATTIPGGPAHGDSDRYDRNDSSRRLNRDRLSDQRDYEVETTTKNVAGDTIRTKTEFEKDRDGYTQKTTTRGPYGLIGRQKVEVERDGNEIEKTTTTTGPNGARQIQRQKYEFND